MRGALTTGTVLSLATVSGWSVTATATANPMPPLHLDWRHHFAASYWALAGAPTGNAIELFAVVAVIYTACLFVAGLRARGRRERDQVQQAPARAAARPMAGARR